MRIMKNGEKYVQSIIGRTQESALKIDKAYTPFLALLFHIENCQKIKKITQKAEKRGFFENPKKQKIIDWHIGPCLSKGHKTDPFLPG